MSTYTARATREDGWWTIEVDEIAGLFTQAKRLDQIPEQVKDALELFPEIEPNPAAAMVRVVPTGEYGIVADEISHARQIAQNAQNAFNATVSTTAHTLHAQGLSYRDIGCLLGVSFQRAAQLVNA